ncbi:MAG: hypothetical protein LBV08_00260 [Clostridiales bacterium]|jgi:hypothetical protein|nr:hypothetical protein [Clostridiales bacterium]
MYNFISPPEKEDVTRNRRGGSGSISMMKMHEPANNKAGKPAPTPRKSNNILDLNLIQKYKREKEAGQNGIEQKAVTQADGSSGLNPSEWTKDMITNKLNQLDEKENNIDKKNTAEGAGQLAAAPQAETLSEGNVNNFAAKAQEGTDGLATRKVITDINELMSTVLNKPIFTAESSESGEIMLGSSDLDIRDLYSNDDDSFLEGYSEGLEDNGGQGAEPELLYDDDSVFQDALQPEPVMPVIAGAKKEEGANLEVKSIMEKINIEDQYFEAQEESTANDYELNYIETFCLKKNIPLEFYKGAFVGFISDKKGSALRKVRNLDNGEFYINFGASRALYSEVNNLINEGKIGNATELLKHICIYSVDTLTANNAFSKLEDISKRADDIEVDLVSVIDDMCKKEEKLLALIYAD